MQETWFDNNCDLPTFQIPNYFCISQSRFCSSHAGLNNNNANIEA